MTTHRAGAVVTYTRRQPDPRRDVILGGHQVYGPIVEQRPLRTLMKDYYLLYQGIPEEYQWTKRMLMYANIIAPIVRNNGCFFRYFRRRRGGEFVVGLELLDLENDPEDRKLVVDKISRALTHAWYQRMATKPTESRLKEKEKPSGVLDNEGDDFSVMEFLNKINGPIPERMFFWLCSDIPHLAILEIITTEVVRARKGDFIAVVVRLSDVSLSSSFAFIQKHVDWFFCSVNLSSENIESRLNPYDV